MYRNLDRNGCSATSSTSLCEGKESFFKKMLELQDKLRKSEEERIRLEERFKLLAEESRIRHQACINRLRMRYVEFLEEQRARDERNGKLLNALDRVDNSLVLMTAKTERLNMLRKQYEEHLLRGYGNQPPQQHHHQLQRHQPPYHRPAAGSTTADSGLESQNELETVTTPNPVYTSRSTPVMPRIEQTPSSPPHLSLISSEPCVLSNYRLPVSNWDSVSRRLDFHLADRRPSIAMLTSFDPPALTRPTLEPPTPIAASTPDDDLDPVEALQRLTFLSPSATAPPQQQKLDGYLSRIREHLEPESRESSEQNTSGDLLNASPLSEDDEAVAGQRRQSFVSLQSYDLDESRRLIQQNCELLAAVEAEESADNDNDGIEDDYDHSVDIDSWMPDDEDVDENDQPVPTRSEPRLRPRTKLESIEEVEPSEDEEQPVSDEMVTPNKKMLMQKPDVDEFDLRFEEMNARSRRNSVLRQQQASQFIGRSKLQEDQQQTPSQEQVELQLEPHQDSIDSEQPVEQEVNREYSEQITQQQYQYSEEYDQQKRQEYSADVDKKQVEDAEVPDQHQQLDTYQQQYQNLEDLNQQPTDQLQYSAKDLIQQGTDQPQYQYSEDLNQTQQDSQQYQYSEDPNLAQPDQQQYQYSEDSNQPQLDQQQYQYPEDPNQQQSQYSENLNQQQYQYSADSNQQPVDQQQYQSSEDPNQQYAYDDNASYSEYENQQYPDGQYTGYSEQQYQQYDQEYQQYDYGEYHQQPQEIVETDSNEQQADDHSQAFAHGPDRGPDPVPSTDALEQSQSEHVAGIGKHPEWIESIRTTSGSSRPATGTTDQAEKPKSKKNNVIASILDSDSESFIERNLSNTESDFDFN